MCIRKLFRTVLKCNSLETEEQIDDCHNEAFFDWWHGCLGQQCQAKLPKGVCFKRCGPPFQNEALKCDGIYPIQCIVYTVETPQ